ETNVITRRMATPRYLQLNSLTSVNERSFRAHGSCTLYVISSFVRAISWLFGCQSSAGRVDWSGCNDLELTAGIVIGGERLTWFPEPANCEEYPTNLRAFSNSVR